MAHPENAYAFNEWSLLCCDAQIGFKALASFLDAARAWRLHESRPLIKRLKAASEFEDLQRDKMYRDKLIVLLGSTANRPSLYDHATERLLWQGNATRGMTVAHILGGFVLSWPCTCECWKVDLIEVTVANSGSSTSCRHVSSEDHLRVHWMRAAKLAKVRSGRPKSVLRVDDAQNRSAGEVPQVHFRDGSALNIDGAWKHGERVLRRDERDWLARVGWVVPNLG